MINTALQVPISYMQREDNSYIPQSFMHAYSFAKEQSDPLHQIKVAAIEQEMQAKSIEIQNTLTQRENTLQAMQGMSKLSALTGEIASNGLWDDPQAKGMVWDTVRQYPALANTQQFKEVLGQFDIARKAAEEKDKANLEGAKVGIEQQRAEAYAGAEASRGKYWDAQAKRITTSQEINGEAVPVKTPEGEVIGYQVQGVRGPHFTPVKTSNPIINMQAARKLTDEINAAEESGNYDQADALREDLRRLDAMHPGLSRALKLPEGDRLKVQSLYQRIGQLNAAREKLGQDQVDERMQKAGEIADLQRQVNAIVGGKKPAASAPSQPKTAPQLKLGATYRDASGKKAIYLGGDKDDPTSWKEVE